MFIVIIINNHAGNLYVHFKCWFSYILSKDYGDNTKTNFVWKQNVWLVDYLGINPETIAYWNERGTEIKLHIELLKQ